MTPTHREELGRIVDGPRAGMRLRLQAFEPDGTPARSVLIPNQAGGLLLGFADSTRYHRHTINDDTHEWTYSITPPAPFGTVDDA